MKITRNAEIIFDIMDDLYILFDPYGGNLFELNEITKDIWELIEIPCDINELKLILCEIYEVSSEKLEKDIDILVHNMLSEGVITTI